MNLTATRPAGQMLIDFWRQTRLRAADASSSPRRPRTEAEVHALDAFADLLRVGYAICPQSRHVGGRWQRFERRSSPSAGALYPFEIVALIAGQPIALWQPDRCCFEALPSSEPSRCAMSRLGIAAAAEHSVEALIVVLARPWTSMKKYATRGYVYSHLDAGHATTHLALYARALGWGPTVHRRFCRPAMRRVLGLGGSCREPLFALSFSARTSSTAEPTALAGTTVLDPPDDAERASWTRLREAGIVDRDDLEDDVAPKAGGAGCAPALATPAAGDRELVLPQPQPAAGGADDLRAAILSRRSAKGFLRDALQVGQLARILAALRDGELRLDGRLPGGQVGLRVVCRRIENAAGAKLDGVWAYDAETHALHRIAASAGDPSRACMGQDLARDAAALLLFHAPMRPLLERYRQHAFTELHFDAAQLAQRLHLQAARGGVGMTCIGGFDEVESGRLGHLTGSDEVIYLALLGRADDRATKHDRDAVAHSHGLV